MLASLSCDAPSLWFSTSTDPKCVKNVEPTEGFGAQLPDYASFDENLHATKKVSQKHLQNWKKRKLAALKHVPEALRRLVLCMIQEAMEHDLAVMELVVNPHRTFTTSCGYQEEDSWHLVGQLVGCFYIHLHEVRTFAMGITDISTLGSKAQMMWAMMKSLKAARDILNVGFSAHPVIIQEVMEFQLEHRADVSHLTPILNKVEALKGQVKDLTAALSKADKANTALADKMTKALQDVGNLKTEMKKKQDKK
jgi:hypothetical protein